MLIKVMDKNMVRFTKLINYSCKTIVLLAGAAIFIFIATGCGGGGSSSGGGPSDSSGPGATNGYVGITECYNCHADGVTIGSAAGAVSSSSCCSTDIFSTWLNGKHGNYEGAGYKGNPGYSDLTATACNACHDELSDGELLSGYYQQTGLSFLGTENRPVVGCESCHGSGSSHFGIGNIVENPGADVCGKCHKKDDYHAASYPEGDNIYADYQASPHASSLSTEIYADGSTTDVKPLCSKCHTDEGARKYTKEDNYSAEYTSQDARFASEADAANANPVKCNTCHDAHSSNTLLLPASGGESSEYRTCTSCHQIVEDSYHGENNPEFNASDTTRTIYDTHYDDPNTPATPLATPNRIIEGYIIDKASERACSDCHNPHNADNTINNEWANSGHGGFILDSIVAGKANVTAKPWLEYTWKYMSNDSSDRKACQRCHTATGFKNLANSPSNYDPANNVFPASGQQMEMLYCWACHTNSVGALRKPGSYVSPRYTTGTVNVTNNSTTVTTNQPIHKSFVPVGSMLQILGNSSTNIVKTLTYSDAPTNQMVSQFTLSSAYTGTTASQVGYVITAYITPAGREIATGTTGSSICASCHSGRLTGEYIKNYPGSLTANFGTFNSHYLADGGIMYRTIGYEFTGQDYSDAVSYVHPTIGSTGGAEGDEGPCVACHMKNDESHSFEVVEGDLGAVTDIKSYTNVCSRCHGNKAALIATLNTRDTQYNAALAALETQLNSKGIYYCASYPYFKNAAACGGATYPVSPATWPNKDTLGAAFNLNLFKNVPAAYVHNREYTRKLIYDSIDFLDDGNLNKSVEATLGGSGNAYDYLNGTR
ncbi:MAG: hypothetical protein HZB61_08085 [Nitrospirae bacterium]|nr:hypothetical protein [Nitrospirota bacterium]